MTDNHTARALERALAQVAVEKVRSSLEKIDRAISLTIPRTMRHDGGAYARCSACRRYSADARALHTKDFPCDCGLHDYWSGSFEAPGADARWSIGVNRL